MRREDSPPAVIQRRKGGGRDVLATRTFNITQIQGQVGKDTKRDNPREQEQRGQGHGAQKQSVTVCPLNKDVSPQRGWQTKGGGAGDSGTRE